MRRNASRYLRVYLIALIAYILLALIMTFPLITEFSTHVTGDGIDAPPLTWNLWWVKHSLVNLNVNPLDCTYLFYPIGINLAFYTLTVLNGVIAIPLQYIIGLVPANNVSLLASFVLGAWGTFLLIEYFLGLAIFQNKSKRRSSWTQGSITYIHLAAFVGGFIYAFSSSKLFFAALGQFNIASSQWIPYYILFLFKIRQKPHSFMPSIMLALFLLFQTWAEMTFASFLILFTVFFFFYHLLSGQGAQSLYRFIRSGLVAAIIFVIGISPILIMMLPDLVSEGDFFVEGTGFAETFSSDVLGLVVPTQLHPVMSDLVESLNFPHDKGQHLFLGFVTLALAICGLIHWKNRGLVRFWGGVSAIFLLLSLGPVAHINGTSLGFPLPFQILQRIPFFNGNRYPGRISVMFVMGLAVLAGFGTYSLLKNISVCRRKYATLLSVALIVLIGFEHLSLPMPIVDLRVSGIYEQIAEDRKDVTLLDIPVAWRNGFRVTGTMDPIIMLEQFAQTVHEKRILAGNTSRNPEYKFQYFTELPVINSIIALETGHRLEPGQVEMDVALAPAVLQFFNIHYIIIHPDQAGDEMVSYIESTMPVSKFVEDDNIIAYRTDLTEIAPEILINLGEPVAAAHLGEGWGEAYVTDDYVWAQRDGSLFMVPLDGAVKKMSFRVWSPGPRQIMRVDLNGYILPGLELAEGWGEYELILPEDGVLQGLNRLDLRFSRLFPAGGVLSEGPPLGRSNISIPVNILAKSAGHEIGNFGHIYLNGENVSLEGIGFNVVALDPETGAILDRQHFNTFASERASQDMVDWISGLADGTVVIVSVRDEASRHLTVEAVEALHTLGLRKDLRGRFRWSYAAIGAKGLKPGQALEDMERLRPATVKLGLGVTEPQVAVAFDWIKFAPY